MKSSSTSTFTREKVRTGKIPVRIKVYQGIGMLPGSHKDLAFNTFLLIYYSQILGLSATWASVAIAVALLVDAISDPLVGAYSDNFRSRRFASLGRRHLFMYAAAIPVGISIYLLFSPPADAGGNTLFVWLMSFTILTRLCFTFYVVPWSALPSELSDDYEERTSLITFRYLMGWIGGIVFLVSVWTFVFPSTDDTFGQLVRSNYDLFAVALGFFVSLWALLTTHLTRNQVVYLRQPTELTPRFKLRMLVDQVRLAFTSPNFRVLFISILLFSGVAGVGGVFDVYMNTYYWEFASEDLRWFAASGLGALLAFVTMPTLQARFEKQNILVVTLGGVMVLGMTKVLFRFADIWPENHDPNLLIALICHVSVVVYLLTTTAIMFGSMIADLVDEQDARRGLRQEGVFASAISFSSKAAPSLGLIFGGYLLDNIIGIPRGSQPGAVADGVLFRMAMIDGVIVNAFFIIPVFLLSRYSLSRDRLQELQEKARVG